MSYWARKAFQPVIVPEQTIHGLPATEWQHGNFDETTWVEPESQSRTGSTRKLYTENTNMTEELSVKNTSMDEIPSIPVTSATKSTTFTLTKLLVCALIAFILGLAIATGVILGVFKATGTWGNGSGTCSTTDNTTASGSVTTTTTLNSCSNFTTIWYYWDYPGCPNAFDGDIPAADINAAMLICCLWCQLKTNCTVWVINVTPTYHCWLKSAPYTSCSPGSNVTNRITGHY